MGFTGDDGNHYVNVSGEMLYGGQEVHALLQFRVFPETARFQYEALTFDDIPQDKMTAMRLLSTALGVEPSNTATGTSVGQSPYEAVHVGISRSVAEQILGTGEEFSESANIKNVAYDTGDAVISITYKDGRVMGKTRRMKTVGP